LTKGVQISARKFASAVILVSFSFAWLFMFFNRFPEIFQHYIPDIGTRYNGYFLFLGVAALSAIVGSVISERTNRRRFLVSWIIVGLISNISVIFTQELGLLYFYLISAILGISIGLGFPSCLAFLADCTTVGERARVTGIAIFATLVLAMLSFIVAMTFEIQYGIELVFLLSALKGTSLLAFVSGDCERRKSERIRPWKNIFVSEDFVLYLFPWLMFSLAGSINNLMFAVLFEQVEYINIETIADVLHYLTWAVVGFISGIMADRIGRKQPLIVGLTSLGVSYAIFGLFTSPETFILYQVLSGVAWGFLFTVYITLLGDLASYGSKEKFYAMGAIMPIILTLSFNTLIGLFNITAPISVLSPVFSIVLFLSVFPVLRATETLPRKKIRERQMKDHIEKVGKILEDHKKHE
jgi:MFS family permease